jgi:MFS family permease
MTPSRPESADAPRLLAPAYAATTIGMFALIAFVAFEALAVTTVMPTVADDLDGKSLYALAFAAPLASGVLGMVLAGAWSDRRGPATPLKASLAIFSLGLVVCGVAPTMGLLVVGRVFQGLGGGALTVGLYVLVGLMFPSALQPRVFASFAAAWVLPSLFGPSIAAWVAGTVGWRWVFLGTVGLVAVAALLVAPALRSVDQRHGDERMPRSRLAWAGAGAGAVVALELLGSGGRMAGLLALGALAVVVLSLRRLLPTGTLVAQRGLPAVIGTRGLMSAAFFCAEAYIVFVLEDHWDVSPGVAGLALSVVGVTWAAASQLQARLGARLSNEAAMRWGTALLLVGVVCMGLVVWAHAHPILVAASYVVAGAGMGLGYPRTNVAMLDASSDSDRGFNSSALSVSDSLGAALALSLAGVVFDASDRAGLDPFVAVLAVATAVGVLGVATAARTRPAQASA